MKSRFTIHHKLQFFIGDLTALASLVFAIVFMLTTNSQIPVHYDLAWNPTRYGNPGVLLIIPLTMLPTNLIIHAIAYFLPPERWNLPSQPKEGCEEKLYQIIAYMLSLIVFESGIYSLLFTVAAAYDIRVLLRFITIAYIVIILATCIIDTVVYVKKNKTQGTTFEV